jgi:hypothetical protein
LVKPTKTVVVGVLSVLIGLVIVSAVVLSTSPGRNMAWAAYKRVSGRSTIAQRLDEVGAAARSHWQAMFNGINMAYPPAKVALVAFKQERVLEVYLHDGAAWRWVDAFAILGASGDLGPKLREGDGQVPEGIYSIESLNPNSRFHLSLKVSYPNQFDHDRAREDGRTNLGGDIMIHGGTASIGCLAMGDPVIEQLFTVVADTGVQNVEVVIVPLDLRVLPPPVVENAPAWLAGHYQTLADKLMQFPNPFQQRAK